MSLFGSSKGSIGDSFAQSTASEAGSTARDAQSRANDAERRIDQLTLICCAMWDLLREKTGLTEQDLIERVALWDAKDGTADGKLSRGPTKCAKCNRTVLPRHQKCMYCGAAVVLNSIFETI
jgi:hypothetical protein